MAFEHKSYENIKKSMKELILTVDKREGSFTDVMLSPIAYELYLAYLDLDGVINTMFLEFVEGFYLELRAEEYGITRKRGTCASCEVIFEGADNITVPKGTKLKYLDTFFETIENAYIVDKTGTAKAYAVEVGAKHNIRENLLELEKEVNGVDGVTNTLGVGGTDIETDEQLKERTLKRIQNPSRSGCKTDYEQWTMAVDGVGRVRCFPLGLSGNVPGTVDILIVDGACMPPTDELINSVSEYIESVRPIGATVNILKPTQKLINVSAKVIPSKGYTVEQVIVAYIDAVNQFLESIRLTEETRVSYGKVASIIYDLVEVADVEEFKVNDGLVSIPFGITEIPVLGQVNFV